MVKQKSQRFFHLVFFLITANFALIWGDCQFDRPYAIRNAFVPDLVLDASETEVKMQYYSGKGQQLWKFVCGDKPGLFFIVNVDSGKFLDVDRQPNQFGRSYVTTNDEDGSLYQQWHVNDNSHITNAAWQYDIDILNATYIPGVQVQIFSTNHWPSQNFTIIEVY